MKVIDVVIVLYGLVTASWTVDVVIMAFVRLMGHRNLLPNRFSVGGYPYIQRSPESVGYLWR